MADRQAHSVVAAKPVGERPELVGRDVDDAAAVLADHGDRAVPDPPVPRRAVPEVYVVDQPDALEVRQRPVERGAVDIGMACGELVDGDPAGLAIEIFEQCSPSPRHATACHTETIERLVETDLGRAVCRRRLGHHERG